MGPKGPGNREKVLNLHQRGLGHARTLHEECLAKPVRAKTPNYWEDPAFLSEGLSVVIPRRE